MLRTHLISVLKSGLAINMSADLACYPMGDGFYAVEYFLNEGIITLKNLTPEQLRLLEDEDEFIEIFEEAEEAVDFFLKIRPESESLQVGSTSQRIGDYVPNKDIIKMPAPVVLKSVNGVPVIPTRKLERILVENEKDSYFCEA